MSTLVGLVYAINIVKIQVRIVDFDSTPLDELLLALSQISGGIRKQKK